MITALYIDNDDKAFYELQELADSAFEQTIAKLKVQNIKDANDNSWTYYLGVALKNCKIY